MSEANIVANASWIDTWLLRTAGITRFKQMMADRRQQKTDPLQLTADGLHQTAHCGLKLYASDAFISYKKPLSQERVREQSERASERVSAAKRASESSSALSQRMPQYLRLGSCLIWPTALLGASRQKTSKNESVLQ